MEERSLTMATIQQQIEVAADPALVRSTWTHFVEWAHSGPGHLLCDEIVCVYAVRSGLVDFAPAANGRTTVIFRMNEVQNGPVRSEIKRQLGHDLVMFKDYVERSGLVIRRRPSATEGAALAIEADHGGDPPRPLRPSSEKDTTSWRSNFPT
jgi:hypothetical protein